MRGFHFTSTGSRQVRHLQTGINAHLIGHPDLLAGLYIGDDFEQPLETTGGALAAPLWAEFMEAALHDIPARDFPIPPGVNKKTICVHSGLLQSQGCRGPGYDEYFIDGTAPVEQCNFLNCPHCLPDYWWPWLQDQYRRQPLYMPLATVLIICNPVGGQPRCRPGNHCHPSSGKANIIFSGISP